MTSEGWFGTKMRGNYKAKEKSTKPKAYELEWHGDSLIEHRSFIEWPRTERTAPNYQLSINLSLQCINKGFKNKDETKFQTVFTFMHMYSSSVSAGSSCSAVILFILWCKRELDLPYIFLALPVLFGWLHMEARSALMRRKIWGCIIYSPVTTNFCLLTWQHLLYKWIKHDTPEALQNIDLQVRLLMPKDPISKQVSTK